MADASPKSQFYAGDSLSWSMTFADYPATTYKARTVFTKPGCAPIPIEGTANGSAFDFAITPQQSAEFDPGPWLWATRVTDVDAGVSKVADSGFSHIDPDPAATDAPEKTHAEKCLELVEAAIEKRLTDTQESISVLGFDATKTSADELRRQRNYYQTLVNRQRLTAEEQLTGQPSRLPKFILRG